jgi:polar amino acid transport system permease protein
MSDVQTATAPPKSWYQRPKVLLGLAIALGLYVLLWNLGTNYPTFGTDVRADGSTNFDPAFAWALVPSMLRALAVTAYATVYGFTIAVVLGLFLALGRRSDKKAVSLPFTWFIEFVRSTPLLVQLLFLFNGLTYFDVLLSPLQALIIGLGVHYATYCSEAYRAGINSVNKGQWEAAIALNLGTVTKWRQVILPQAIPNVIPALGNFLVAGFKDAPLGFVVNVTGLLFFANTIRGRAFRPVEPLILIGIGFLLVSLPAAWLVRRLEERVSYERI